MTLDRYHDHLRGICDALKVGDEALAFARFNEAAAEMTAEQVNLMRRALMRFDARRAA